MSKESELKDPYQNEFSCRNECNSELNMNNNYVLNNTENRMLCSKNKTITRVAGEQIEADKEIEYENREYLN